MLGMLLGGGALLKKVTTNKYFIRALLIGVLAFTVLVGWNHYNMTVAEAARLQADLNDTEDELLAQIEEADRQQREATRLQTILRDREQARAALAQELEHRLDQIKQLEEQNEEARTWMRRPMPDAVIELLRSETGAREIDSEMPTTTNRTHGGVPQARVDGPDHRRSVGVDGAAQ